MYRDAIDITSPPKSAPGMNLNPKGGPSRVTTGHRGMFANSPLPARRRVARSRGELVKALVQFQGSCPPVAYDKIGRLFPGDEGSRRFSRRDGKISTDPFGRAEDGLVIKAVYRHSYVNAPSVRAALVALRSILLSNARRPSFCRCVHRRVRGWAPPGMSRQRWRAFGTSTPR